MGRVQDHLRRRPDHAGESARNRDDGGDADADDRFEEAQLRVSQIRLGRELRQIEFACIADRLDDRFGDLVGGASLFKAPRRRERVERLRPYGRL